MLEKTKTWLTKPTIQPYRVIIAFLGIAVVIFMDTDLYDSFSSIAKAGVYMGLMFICVLTRLSMMDMKQLALKLKQVIEDKTMSVWEKIQAFTQIGIDAFSKAGENWELYTDEQFRIYNQQIVEEKLALEDKITDLNKKIALLEKKE